MMIRSDDVRKEDWPTSWPWGPERGFAYWPCALPWELCPNFFALFYCLIIANHPVQPKVYIIVGLGIRLQKYTPWYCTCWDGLFEHHVCREENDEIEWLYCLAIVLRKIMSNNILCYCGIDLCLKLRALWSSHVQWRNNRPRRPR